MKAEIDFESPSTQPPMNLVLSNVPLTVPDTIN